MCEAEKVYVIVCVHKHMVNPKTNYTFSLGLAKRYSELGFCFMSSNYINVLFHKLFLPFTLPYSTALVFII